MTKRLRDNSIYSDVSQHGVENDAIVRDVNSVRQALNNLLDTLRGERLFNNNGLNPKNQLFELGTGSEAQDFLSELVRELNNQEPRVVVDLAKTTIIPDYDNNRNELRIVFSLEGLETETFELIRSI